MKVKIPTFTKLFLIIALSGFTEYTHSQTSFNILPDVGGIDMNGVCRTSLLDSISIYIIGHRYDTSGKGSSVKPWLGEFNYSGVLVNLNPLIDSTYNEPFYAEQVFQVYKNDSTAYIYARRDTEGPFFTPYLFELNVFSGAITNSVLLPNPEYPDGKSGIGGIVFSNDTVSLLSYIITSDTFKLYVTQLDTMLKVINTIKLPQTFKDLYPLYFNAINNRIYECIGSKLVMDPKSDTQYTGVHILRWNKKTNQIIARKIPTDKHYSFSSGNSHSSLKTTDNTWIIGVVNVEDKSDSCQNCFVTVPHVLALSEDFDSILWETKFYDIPFQYSNSHLIHSIASVDDGYVVSGNYQSSGDSGFPSSSGFLLKTSKHGDSLWMKHYIPLGWEGERVSWARLRNINTTPYGSIIAVGEIKDKELDALRPWILHLDKDGCLIPGCNTVGTNLIPTKEERKYQFDIFPNPASEELYILSKSGTGSIINIKIVNIEGKIVKSTKLNSIKDYQYIISLRDLPYGQYIILFEDTQNKSIESHLLLRQ